MPRKKTSGFSIVEILVVIMIFAVIAILATESIALSLRGSKRSESTISVRENLNYSLAVIERALHNAESVTCVNPTILTYSDILGLPAEFSCDLVSGLIASSSARLTSSEVKITACKFICNSGASGVPPSVTISITAENAFASGLEQAQVTTNTQIMLRAY